MPLKTLVASATVTTAVAQVVATPTPATLTRRLWCSTTIFARTLNKITTAAESVQRELIVKECVVAAPSVTPVTFAVVVEPRAKKVFASHGSCLWTASANVKAARWKTLAVFVKETVPLVPSATSKMRATTTLQFS